MDTRVGIIFIRLASTSLIYLDTSDGRIRQTFDTIIQFVFYQIKSQNVNNPVEFLLRMFYH